MITDTHPAPGDADGRERRRVDASVGVATVWRQRLAQGNPLVEEAEEAERS